jgi:undecaprenyl-diphosphatase
MRRTRSTGDRVLPPLSGERPPAIRPAAVAVRLSVGLITLLGLLLLVGYLLTRAHWGDRFERVDRAMVDWLAAHRVAGLDAVSSAAGALGNTTVVVTAGAVAAVGAAIVRRQWRPVVLVAVALVGELTIFLITTALIDRPRPPVPHLDAHLPPTSSFPSGHTAAALCLYGVLAAVVLAETRGRWRGPVVCCAVALVVVVAMSRLYRGAHYPTDVLASVLFALPWLLLTVRLLPLGAAAAPSGVGGPGVAGGTMRP